MLLGFPASMVAKPAQDANSSRSMDALTTAIQSELDAHGERMLGKAAYGWSTRLNKIEDCRAEFLVRVTSNLAADLSVQTENVKFSFGAINPYGIVLDKNRVELPCARKDNCILSLTTCTTKTKAGIVTDCSTASQKRVDSFTLELDGDVAAASRLEQAVRQAVELCHVPQPVTF
jgi:hypothetical protein